MYLFKSPNNINRVFYVYRFLSLTAIISSKKKFIKMHLPRPITHVHYLDTIKL